MFLRFLTVFLLGVFYIGSATYAAQDCSLFLDSSPIIKSKKVRSRIDVTSRSLLVSEIEQTLIKNVIGQPEIRNALLNALDRIIVAKPLRGAAGTIMIPGETGVGKNKSLEVLAEAIGGKLIELEGGNFQQDFQVTNLTGAPAGYVGHGKTIPALTATRIAEAEGTVVPITIIALNELDKASQSFIDWWLKGLDTGYNTVWVPSKENGKAAKSGGNKSASGAEAVEEIIDFSRSLIVVTTNAGASIIKQQSEVLLEEVKKIDEVLALNANGYADFLNIGMEPDGFREAINQEILYAFQRPEFLGRFDEIAVAWGLLDKGYERIFELEMRKARKEIESMGERIKNLPLRATLAAKKWILQKRQPAYGARNISKLVKNHVLSPLTRAIASGAIQNNDSVIIDVDPETSELVFHKFEITNSGGVDNVLSVDPLSNNSRGEKIDEVSAEELERMFTTLSNENVSASKRLTSGILAIQKGPKTLDGLKVEKILSSMPLGVDWIYKEPSPSVVQKLKQKYNLKDWEVSSLHSDLEILFELLLKIEPIDSTNFSSNNMIHRLEKLSKKIISRSAINKKTDKAFIQELEGLVQSILAEKKSV